MNLGELTTRTLQIAREEADSFWSTDDVHASLNEGLDELADLAEFCEAVFTIPLLADRTYYDVAAHLPPNEQFLAPRRVNNLLNNEWLEWVTARYLDARYYRQWEQVRLAPSYCFPQGLGWLGIHGASSDDAGTLRMTAVTIPPHLTNDTDIPRFPPQFQLAAVEYAVYDLYVQDNEIDLALLHWKEFIALGTRFAQEVYTRLQTDRAFKFGMARTRRYP